MTMGMAVLAVLFGVMIVAVAVIVAATRAVTVSRFMRVRMAVMLVGNGLLPFRAVGFDGVGVRHGGFLVRFVV